MSDGRAIEVPDATADRRGGTGASGRAETARGGANPSGKVPWRPPSIRVTDVGPGTDSATGVRHGAETVDSSYIPPS